MTYDRYVTHAMVRGFARENVNLRREDVKDYRDQVGRLRKKLEEHIAEHPDYALVKMRHSGSVAKGTALKTINDMDVAVYVESEAAPQGERELLSWLEERLKEAYPNHPSQNIVPQDHCVTMKFTGSGLDVDVVPVLYEGEADDVGYLIEKYSGARVKTSVTQHLKFIRKRKDAQPEHFAQVVRLLKWWVRQVKRRQADFRFKSFMIELLCAHLADGGLDCSNYPAALEEVLAYTVRTELDERIAFTDFYAASALPGNTAAEIEIFDPVNAENNVAERYSRQQRLAIVEAAHEAGDALAEAAYATTKQRAIERWQTVLGPSFNP
jgi:tRNA nucleotidyltransferase (CCA-adding enzyme)